MFARLYMRLDADITNETQLKHFSLAL